MNIDLLNGLLGPHGIRGEVIGRSHLSGGGPALRVHFRKQISGQTYNIVSSLDHGLEPEAVVPGILRDFAAAKPPV